MDKIASLFTAIGDLFSGASWFQSIQWPFWTLLALLAVGGVYNARFGKNTLMCRGVTCALKLVLIYLTAAGLYHFIPGEMAELSQLPFMSVSDESIVLVNPLDLLDRWSTTLPRVMVRFFLLMFCISVVEIFNYNGQKILSWIAAQFVTCLISFGIYCMVTACVVDVFSGRFNILWIDYIISIIILSVLAFLIIGKFLFTVIIKNSGNKLYGTVYKFFTTNSFGSLVTAAAIGTALLLLFLIIVDFCGASRFALSSFNLPAYCIVFVLCCVALYVFGMFYTTRKK